MGTDFVMAWDDYVYQLNLVKSDGYNSYLNINHIQIAIYGYPIVEFTAEWDWNLM